MPKRKPLPGAPPELSRTALEDFLRCPRCFYLHRKRGLKKIPSIPLTLAVATDALLKNEFDAIRGTEDSHPVWQAAGLEVRAFAHPELEDWRSNFKGRRAVHAPTGATIYGAVDDIWENRRTGELHIVDYKSTSKQGTPDLEGLFGAGYKRQIEIYQWLFRQAGFSVSPIGYFLYVNGSKQGVFYEGGEGRMRFETTLIAHHGDAGWVEDCISAAVACYNGIEVPESAADCETCRYVAERAEINI